MRFRHLALLGLCLVLTLPGAGAAALPDEELVAGGGFETSLAGWRSYNGTLARVAGGAEGAYAARVTGTRSGTVSIYPSPRTVRSTTAGAAYVAGARVRGEVPGRTYCLAVREWVDGAKRAPAESCLVGTGGWQRFSPVRYTATATGAELEVYVYERSSAKGRRFDVDAVSLRPDVVVPDEPPAGLYVSPSGSDAAAGTYAAPLATIARALDTVEPGETIWVRAGTYDGWLTAARGGTAEAPVTLAAYPGERPRLTGRLEVTGSHIRVRGFLFEGGTAANPDDVLLYVSGADHVEILGNELRNAAMSAMYLGDVGNGADHARIVGNYVHDNGTHWNLDHGIYYGTGRGGYIANNVVEGNYAKGIQLYPDCDDALVANNTVVGNGRIGIIVGGEPVSTADGNRIVNNVVAFNGETGIRTYWGGSVGTGNVALRNLVYGHPRGDLAGPGLELVDNLRLEPRFAGATDYRLSAGSPAVDAALAPLADAFDIDGVPRGSAPDLGAYERS